MSSSESASPEPTFTVSEQDSFFSEYEEEEEEKYVTVPRIPESSDDEATVTVPRLPESSDSDSDSDSDDDEIHPGQLAQKGMIVSPQYLQHMKAEFDRIYGEVINVCRKGLKDPRYIAAVHKYYTFMNQFKGRSYTEGEHLKIFKRRSELILELCDILNDWYPHHMKQVADTIKQVIAGVKQERARTQKNPVFLVCQIAAYRLAFRDVYKLWPKEAKEFLPDDIQEDI